MHEFAYIFIWKNSEQNWYTKVYQYTVTGIYILQRLYICKLVYINS